MSTSILVIIAVAGLTSFGLWLSTRVAPFVLAEPLPTRYRRRVQWWLANASHVQAGCLLVVVAAGAVELVRTLQ